MAVEEEEEEEEEVRDILKAKLNVNQNVSSKQDELVNLL